MHIIRQNNVPNFNCLLYSLAFFSRRVLWNKFLFNFQVELTANHSEIAKNGLRRLWGVPDTSAYVGHLFRMEIPKEAFSGEVLAYKVHLICDAKYVFLTTKLCKYIRKLMILHISTIIYLRLLRFYILFIKIFIDLFQYVYYVD